MVSGRIRCHAWAAAQLGPVGGQAHLWAKEGAHCICPYGYLREVQGDVVTQGCKTWERSAKGAHS